MYPCTHESKYPFYYAYIAFNIHVRIAYIACAAHITYIAYIEANPLSEPPLDLLLLLDSISSRDRRNDETL